MQEFSFISKLLSPLTFNNKEALGLKDDAAIIPSKPGYDIVITKDMIAEGTHFFKGDDPKNLAKKLLRVNISDLAAKGATPYCCFLSIALPKNISEKWLKDFSSSLKEDLNLYGLFLSGGDTIAHNGNLVLSLTALGLIKKNKTILRSGAKEGDLIFVTGNIGDSYLGLQILKGDLQTTKKNCELLVSRYHLPQPRIQIGKKLVNIASSAVDISDGLIADLEHICECSEAAAIINLNDIPLSTMARDITKKHPNLLLNIISGGDDYEILFTASQDKFKQIKQLSKSSGIPIIKIGSITKGKNIRLLDDNGKEIEIKNKGYEH